MVHTYLSAYIGFHKSLHSSRKYNIRRLLLDCVKEHFFQEPSTAIVPGHSRRHFPFRNWHTMFVGQWLSILQSLSTSPYQVNIQRSWNISEHWRNINGTCCILYKSSINDARKSRRAVAHSQKFHLNRKLKRWKRWKRKIRPTFISSENFFACYSKIFVRVISYILL